MPLQRSIPHLSRGFKQDSRLYRVKIVQLSVHSFFLGVLMRNLATKKGEHIFKKARNA
jgi:hypothetical protein